MALKISTGLANYALGTGSVKTALNLGFLKIYAGSAPASADAAVTGTLLCTISSNGTGTGITLGTASANTIPKNAGETWKGTNGNTGTATHFRHVGASDDGSLSTSQPRIQGVVSTAGSDMNLSSTSLSSGAEQTIDYYQLTWPLS